MAALDLGVGLLSDIRSGHPRSIRARLADIERRHIWLLRPAQRAAGRGMTTSTIEKFPEPAPAERTPAEQAAYVAGVADAKTAIVPLLGNRSLDPTLAQACAAIDAACLPEPEEEIEVTEAMADAGYEASETYTSVAEHGSQQLEYFTVIFTAMERQRRKDGKAEDEKKPPFDMRKFAEEGGTWNFEADRPIDERRKDET